MFGEGDPGVYYAGVFIRIFGGWPKRDPREDTGKPR